MAGRRIDDHNSWVGKSAPGKVYPDGAKTKTETSADGFGALNMYEGTSEMIKKQQEINAQQVHKHPHKEHYRN